MRSLTYAILASLFLSLACSGFSRGGESSNSFHGATFGDTVFPPPGLSRESEAAQLAEWLGGSLAVNTNVTPAIETTERSLIDGFNRSFGFGASIHSYSTGSESLQLLYALSSAEFVSFELAFLAPRALNGSSLADVARSTASSLGMPLTGSTYSEHESVFGEPDFNGTVTRHRTGFLSERRGSFEVNHANQIWLLENVNTDALLYVRAFRWLTNLTAPGFTPDDIVTAASEVANGTYDERGTLSSHAIGIAPNYGNATVSLFVSLAYNRADGTGVAYVLFLDFDTLDFQQLVYRVVWAGGPPGFVLWQPMLAALLLACVLIVGLAWRARRRRVRLAR